jgi:uncharacterized protein YoxC
MDITQIVILTSLIIVTIIIITTSIYFIKILKELKTTVSKVNEILDDTQSITESVSRPISSLSEFLMGFQNGFKVFNSFMKHRRHDKDEDEQ